jgi:hypothetical protein
MGDWNSVVGDKSNGNICGPYGLENKNKRGQMLIDTSFISCIQE